jgi:phosphomannomutase
MTPSLTVSGYRGIWGETLTEDIARDYVQAFGKLVEARGGKKILVGRDGRKSGPLLAEAVIQELLTLGFDVVDLGMMPTPTVLFLIQTENAGGAVIVTASHNPIEYNGLKFAMESGAFTTEKDVAEIEVLRRPGAAQAPRAAAACQSGADSRASSAGKSGASAAPGSRIDGNHLFTKHLDAIAAHIDFDSIRAAGFKVAIDPINSVGCTTTPLLLARAGATVFGINTEPTGDFAHGPEPVAKNLTGLEALVRESGADVGFAQDPDGDRLVLCDETGTILSEEFTLPLCLKAILQKKPGDVVINLSTSNVSEDIAATYGSKTFRSKVGEANVVQAIREHGAVAGGEGSSGAIWPAVNSTRDSYVCMALILELMAKDGRPLSEIAASLPKYFMTKNKIPRNGELAELYQNLIETFPEATADTRDGLRLDFGDRAWLQVRPSNTEPIVRIFSEAASRKRAEALAETAHLSLTKEVRAVIK